jgi:hypothetical protein
MVCTEILLGTTWRPLAGRGRRGHFRHEHNIPAVSWSAQNSCGRQAEENGERNVILRVIGNLLCFSGSTLAVNRTESPP